MAFFIAARTVDTPSRSPSQDATRLVTRLLRNAAAQDVAVLAFAALLCLETLLRVRGAHGLTAQLAALGILAYTLLICALTRGELLDPGPLRAIVYRAGLFSAIGGSYFLLRGVLPALHPVLLDGSLARLDAYLFGKTPALWLDRYVSPTSVEWFAFFYYSYYALLACHFLGTLLFDSGRRRYELLCGAALVASIGHFVYTLVPGIGPFACRDLVFAHPLTGGAWWNRASTAVNEAGAGLDIFPSLHTGFSMLIALHAARHRASLPYKVTWLPTCFMVANIVIATVFLRWHYGVDLIAGGLLAAGAQRFAMQRWSTEGQRSARNGRQQVWEPVLPVDMDLADRRWVMGIFSIQLVGLALLASISLVH